MLFVYLPISGRPWIKLIHDLCNVFSTLSHASEHGQGYKIKRLQHGFNNLKMKPGKDHKRHEEQHHCSQTKQQHCAATLLSSMAKRELSLNNDCRLLCPSYREQSPNPRTFFHFSNVYPSCAQPIFDVFRMIGNILGGFKRVVMYVPIVEERRNVLRR